jgi:hypothetical protein
VRALAGDRASLGIGRRLRLRLLPLALALVLGDAPASLLRPRRHARASILAPADQPEREVALRLLPQALHGGEQIVCDKGYAGREFAAEVEARFAAEVLRPNRKDEPEGPVHLAMIRQRIESVFWTLKDRLGLERHRARTLTGLRVRIASKLLALAAGVWVNTLLGLPSRSFAHFAA